MVTVIATKRDIGSLACLARVAAREMIPSHILVHLAERHTARSAVAHRLGHLRIVSTSRDRVRPCASLALGVRWATVSSRNLLILPCCSAVCAGILWFGTIRRTGCSATTLVDLGAVVAVTVRRLLPGALLSGVDGRLRPDGCHTAARGAPFTAAFDGRSRLLDVVLAAPKSCVGARLALRLVGVLSAGTGATGRGFDIPAVVTLCEAILATSVIDRCAEGLNE